jgi:GT2 family glycosyltransferase
VTISVIVPTCDRTESLARCLEQLGEADEILVSDDSRTSGSRQLLASRFPKARWLQGPRRGPAANRNHASRYATGDWLAFVDDDCIPDCNWVNEITKLVAAADVIEGRTICPAKTNHPLEEVIENETGNLFWTCNLAIRRDRFEELAGFDEDFLEPGGEDLEFAWRIKQKRLTVRFASDMIVYHPARKLPLLKWVYRVFQLRWHLLYRLKVTDVRCATLNEILDLLRVTKRTVMAPGRNRRSFFRLILQWLLFPIWVPYLIYWELKFRKMVAKPRHD